MGKCGKSLLTITAILGTTTALIHAANRMIESNSSFFEILGGQNDNTYDWRLGKVVYTKRGKGSPVLLIHDTAAGCSSYDWNRVIGKMAEDHTVYTVDLLGYGKSDKPGITYTNYIFAQLIADFCKNVIREKTDVVAHGNSTAFAMMASKLESDYIDKLVFINPVSLTAYTVAPTKKDKLKKKLLEIPVFGTFVYNFIVSRETMKNIFIEHFYYDPFHIDRDLLAAHYEAAHKGGMFAKFAFASFFSKYMNIDIRKALATTNHEVYIMMGSEKTKATSIVNEYKATQPDIECYVVPKAKHYPQYENIPVFLDQMVEILW